MTHSEDMPESDLPVESSQHHPEKRRVTGVGVRLGVAMVRFYQKLISPLLPPSCRYQPSCSQYTLTAIQRYGLFRGSWMGIKRISRCHPFHPGGHDPVP